MHTAIRLLLIANVAASLLPTPTTILPHASPLRTAAITAARQPPPAAAAAAYAAPPPAAARPGAAPGVAPLGAAMWQAVGARDFTEVDRLLRRGADPNMVCPDGWVTEAARPRQLLRSPHLPLASRLR